MLSRASLLATSRLAATAALRASAGRSFHRASAMAIAAPASARVTPAVARASMAARAFSASAVKLSSDGKVVDAEFKPEDAKKENTTEPEPAKPAEVIKGSLKKHEFQAETRKLLDIVANSLYSEKEVFVREVISNASDALEKLRYLQATNAETYAGSKGQPLQIRIDLDEAANTFTVQDTGVGMTEAELIKNLGTIAHSGSKTFVAESSKSGVSKDNIIGQFGVGFYSTFMVGKTVTVYSRSAAENAKGYVWISDGSGAYELAEADNVAIGTKIVVQLKAEEAKYASKTVIEDIIRKYSNFVGFSIFLNNELVNTLQPVWTMDPKSVTAEMHTEFYRFIADTYDEPTFTLQYRTDSPLNIRSVFYFPQTHMEKFGMGRMEPGVSLYSRKVLIQPKSKQLLPEWLRFVRGVVDSEDLPLNLSREILQNNLLINKLKSVLTTRILRFLQEQVKKDATKYDAFFNDFGNFLREGVCTDPQNKGDIAKLLRFESSKTEDGKKIGLEEYVARNASETAASSTEAGAADAAKDTKAPIYYLCVPSRELAKQSPYFESFQKRDIEVLFLYEPLDDIVMQNLQEFAGRRVVSIESSKADDSKEDSELDKIEWVKSLSSWLQTTLGSKRVSSVRATRRLVQHPAIIVDHESASMRRMLRMIDTSRTYTPSVALEINPDHPVIVKLGAVKESNPELAEQIAEQLLDNALIAAGVLDDARSILGRINTIMEKALDSPAKPKATETKQ
ncbi:heat shock protein [Capsaspora owczarzaki ATCC 30864]|nr:heat shock protein [Capsaspora owczarzaki ATCC 30864]|eukprot:XP_004364211.2 heat shock protein [Capsaspora owczarzaki ATCC 30864]